MPRLIKWYGWIPDLPDHRDFVFMAPRPVVAKLPAKADLRPQCPPVYDQGELGSCTANAIAAAHQFDQMRQKCKEVEQKTTKVTKNPASLKLRRASQEPRTSPNSVFCPSRLFIYYNERVIEGTTDQDSGAMIRDGIKSIAKQGVCEEAGNVAQVAWPYVISKYRVKPPKSCYTEALNNQALTYYSVRQDLDQMKGCLAAGYPFVFGFSVYESFESAAVAKTGNAPMPKPREKQLGGHAVMAVGYDDLAKTFTVRNSWGTGWGMKGYFTLPYAYLCDSNLASDFWTVRLVE